MNIDVRKRLRLNDNRLDRAIKQTDISFTFIIVYNLDLQPFHITLTPDPHDCIRTVLCVC